MPWRHHTNFICVQLNKRCVFKLCRGTKLRQRHEDTGITIIFFIVVENIDKQCNISLFHHKAYKKISFLPADDDRYRRDKQEKTGEQEWGEEGGVTWLVPALDGRLACVLHDGHVHTQEQEGREETQHRHDGAGYGAHLGRGTTDLCEIGWIIHVYIHICVLCTGKFMVF